MFVSGFTIARNVVKADYPLKEAVFSILPLCDEFVIAVGRSEDTTLEYVRSFDSPKIRILETEWDDGLRSGGKVLAIETNKAMDFISAKADWCFYIQADECLHEKYIETVRQSMISNLDKKEVQGLLFAYRHFYAKYDYVADSRSWYRHEVRIIRNDPGIRSYKDAQGFRADGRKLKVKKIDAEIFHYGWVKHPVLQLEKLKQARKLWHSDTYLSREYDGKTEFDFSHIDSLNRYEGTHPAVMSERIRQKNWSFEHDVRLKKLKLRKYLLYLVEKWTGWRPGENKNYTLI